MKTVSGAGFGPFQNGSRKNLIAVRTASKTVLAAVTLYHSAPRLWKLTMQVRLTSKSLSDFFSCERPC